MSTNWYRDVAEFHDTMINFLPVGLCCPSQDTLDLRQELILEETRELRGAIGRYMQCFREEYVHQDQKAILQQMVGVAQETADLIYVLLGRLVEMGINFPPVWDAVHKANMAKEPCKTSETCKIDKPKNWEPPDVHRILNDQWRNESGQKWSISQWLADTRKQSDNL